MAIYSLFVINKAGGLIYHQDVYTPKSDIEKTFGFPLDLVLKNSGEKVVVTFGQRDGIKVGHVILEINGRPTNGIRMEDGREILTELANAENYPINIKFGRPKLTSNEKLVLASMFHSLFAISCQLSPEHRSSGIELLEADTFKLHCYQTVTGIKFIIIADPKLGGVDALLRKFYEIYSDFALKNPFYSLEMPIRCELFEQNLQLAIESIEKAGMYSGNM